MPSRCEDVHQVLSQKVKEIGKIIKFFAGEYCKSWKRFSIGCSGLISLSGVDSFSMTAETAFHSCP